MKSYKEKQYFTTKGANCSFSRKNKANEGTANTLNLFEGDLPFPVCRLVIPTEPLQKNIRRGKPDLIIQRNGSPPLHSVMVVETFDRTP